MSFTPRTTAPSTSSKWWKHTTAGGVNNCIHIGGGSVLPNCVGYAWGRFSEIMGKTCKLSRRNAEDWYGYTADGYARGKTPKLGAVICWRRGQAGNGADGAGHVAIVEAIYNDGSILISQSGYKSTRFWTSKVQKGYALAGYVFQGFIYNPAVSEAEYKAGNNYTLQANMKVRTGAGTNHAQKKKSALTVDGQKHALNQEMAVLKAGTIVTALAVIKSGNDVWLKIPSGYVCAKDGGETYIV